LTKTIVNTIATRCIGHEHGIACLRMDENGKDIPFR